MLRQVCDKTLPYKRLEEVRQRLEHVAPNLVRINAVEEANYFQQAAQLAKVRVKCAHAHQLFKFILILSSVYGRIFRSDLYEVQNLI